MMDSHAKVRVRLIVLTSQRDSGKADLRMFVEPDGSLVGKRSLCNLVSEKVDELESKQKDADELMKQLDGQIEAVQKSKTQTSYKIRKGLAQAVEMYDLLSKDRGIVDYSTDQFYLRAQEDSDLERFQRKRQNLRAQMMKHKKRKDTLAKQIQAMQLFLEDQATKKNELVAQDNELEIKAPTYDKNLDKVCALYSRKKGGMDAFRKELLEQPRRFFSGKHLRIEHFFRPDGTARPTPAEVCMAIRLYGNRRFWGLFGN